MRFEVFVLDLTFESLNFDQPSFSIITFTFNQVNKIYKLIKKFLLLKDLDGYEFR